LEGLLRPYKPIQITPNKASQHETSWCQGGISKPQDATREKDGEGRNYDGDETAKEQRVLE